MPYYTKDQRNFDNHPHRRLGFQAAGFTAQFSGAEHVWLRQSEQPLSHAFTCSLAQEVVHIGCTCMYIYRPTHIQMCTYIYVYTSNIQTQIHIHVYMYIYIHIHICMYTDMHLHICTDAHTFMSLYKRLDRSSWHGDARTLEIRTWHWLDRLGHGVRGLQAPTGSQVPKYRFYTAQGSFKWVSFLKRGVDVPFGLI